MEIKSAETTWKVSEFSGVWSSDSGLNACCVSSCLPDAEALCLTGARCRGHPVCLHAAVIWALCNASPSYFLSSSALLPSFLLQLPLTVSDNLQEKVSSSLNFFSSSNVLKQPPTRAAVCWIRKYRMWTSVTAVRDSHCWLALWPLLEEV